MREDALKRAYGVPLIAEYRGSLLENLHCGHICVVDEHNRISACVGNPQHVTYMRSSAKPIQALAFLSMGLDIQYGLNDQELTLIAGSHQGGEYHVDALCEIARKMDIKEEQLVLLPTPPADAEFRDAAVAAGRKPRKFYHNCAGKHLATIAMARALGQSDKTYYQSGTPVQEYLLSFLARIVGLSVKEIVLGVDGCGVPVYGLPLFAMAQVYLLLACPDLLNDENLKKAVIQLDRIMHENPQYINKENYICTCMNLDPNVFAKGGAQGIYCFALKKQRLGIAFKIMDGSEKEWQLVIYEIMRQLGVSDSVAMNQMVRLRPFEIINATGSRVGQYEPVFHLAAPISFLVS